MDLLRISYCQGGKKKKKGRKKLANSWQVKQPEKPQPKAKSQDEDILAALRQRKGRTNALTNLVTLDKEKQDMLVRHPLSRLHFSL